MSEQMDDALAAATYRAGRAGLTTHERPRVPLERARRVAEAIVEALRPACERIEIAGSIRRGVPAVKDIEVVAVPRGLVCDLFGSPVLDQPHDLDRELERLVDAGRLRARVTPDGRVRLGPRFKALEAVRAELPVDLFIVLPPAQWGCIFAIRTGPAEFGRRLVMACRARGLRCQDGRLVDARGRTVPTPEERDFFRACGMGWVPEDRR